jgi:hypothetical protein
MFIPLTGLTTVLGVVVMLGAWVFVKYRIEHVHAVVLRPVRLLHSFFLYMLIFFSIMSLPYYWLATAPEQFPVAMAWGYVVGHIFLYLAFMQVARMTCAIVPKLNNKETAVIWIWSIIAVVITIVNAKTMIWGIQPMFDYQNNITLFRAHVAVGATIGIMAAISIFPAAIMFIINAFKSQGPRRVRSLLLGAGFFMMMTAGPMHDIAHTGAVYAFADIVTMLSMIIVGIGVGYRLEQSLSLSKEAPVVVAPSSNTV